MVPPNQTAFRRTATNCGKKNIGDLPGLTVTHCDEKRVALYQAFTATLRD